MHISIGIVFVVHGVQFSNDIPCPVRDEIVHLTQDVYTSNYPLEPPVYIIRSASTAIRYSRHAARNPFQDVFTFLSEYLLRTRQYRLVRKFSHETAFRCEGKPSVPLTVDMMKSNSSSNRSTVNIFIFSKTNVRGRSREILHIPT